MSTCRAPRPDRGPGRLRLAALLIVGAFAAGGCNVPWPTTPGNGGSPTSTTAQPTTTVATTVTETPPSTLPSPTPGGGGDGGGDGGGGGGEAGGEVPVTPPPDSQATRVITSADQAELAGGFQVPAGEVWELAPDQNVELAVSGNIVVEGILRMRPASAAVVHRIQFVGIDESNYVGGGHMVLDTDIGLWVMGAGQLDLQGAERTGWTTLEGGADQGATTLTLAETPTGWQVGDEIVIAPTAAPTTRGHNDQFDEQTIAAIDGNTVTLAGGLAYAHPVVNGQWTAEVMNLTRNVQLAGGGATGPEPATTDGRAHLMVHADSPQSIRYVSIRGFGPRTGGRGESSGVLGRYSLHFHHSGDGSRGSLVEGVVVRDSGNSAFVPHNSNGITMRDDIAYNGYENAFWWDPPADSRRAADESNDTNDLLWEHDIVARLRTYPEFRGYGLAAFTMATGSNVTIRDSVAVGIGGNESASGFRWPANNNGHPHNVWTFENNLAHNNLADGIFVWQNDGSHHTITDFVAYNNGEDGIEHGAYLNGYEYDGVQLFGNGESAMQQHSAGGGSPGGAGLSFTDLASDGPLVLKPQNLPSKRPALYLRCSFTGVEIVNDGNADNAGYYDFVGCGLQPDQFTFRAVEPGTTIRVQNGSEAYQLNDQGTMSPIAPFHNG